MKSLLFDEHIKPGPYNIATGAVKNQADVVKEVLKHFPSLRPTYKRAELPQQIQEETMQQTRWHWTPSWSFDDAIERTVALFEKYREDWK